MNIFILSSNPTIAARYHCDQHLHKMILESAQLVSTAAHTLSYPASLLSQIYKPAYPNHPCTRWACESSTNVYWILSLATELEVIRQELGFNPHASSEIIAAIKSYLEESCGFDVRYLDYCSPFALAMYGRIKVRNDLTTVQKYQLYYRTKHKEWALDKGAGMNYKGRPVPDFMTDLISPESN